MIIKLPTKLIKLLNFSYCTIAVMAAVFLSTSVSAQDPKLVFKIPSTPPVQAKPKPAKVKAVPKKIVKPEQKIVEKPVEPVVEKVVEKEVAVEPVEVWQPSSARGLKKKILISAFSIAKTNQVVDIADPAQGFPLEVFKRLQQNRLVLPRFTPESLLSDAQQTEPQASMIRQVAGQYDSQYIVIGHIRHADKKVEPKLLGLWHTNKRTLELEIVIYEGQSGVALKRQMFSAWAEDDTKIGRDKAFASAGFEATSFGKVIGNVITQASDWIAEELETMPMMTRVLKVDGATILLDAGSSSFMSAGDVGTLIAESESLPVMAIRAVQHSSTMIGSPIQELGLIKIHSTQSTFSEAKLAKEMKADAVKVGQWVRFESRP